MELEKSLEARQILVERNLRLVVYIAKKFESTGIGLEDLISIGTIGLIKAVKTFCPEKKIKLATYASRCIENEILMFMRKASQHRNEISIDDRLKAIEQFLSSDYGSPNDIDDDTVKNLIDKIIVNDDDIDVYLKNGGIQPSVIAK